MNKIDTYLDALPEWQKTNLEQFRILVNEVYPEVEEDFKWNVPVFMINGKVHFAMSAFRAHTKYNFMANGATIEDVDQLFNNGFDSKKSRGIDIREGDAVDQDKLKRLIQVSVNA